MSTTPADDVSALTYEAALAELDAIVDRLEKGSVDLEEAIACYERGTRLAQRCADLLEKTERKVTQLVVGAGGAVEERPFEPDGAAGEAGRTATPAFPGVEPRARAVRPNPIDPNEIPF